jgi:rare lipoprotein A
MKALWVFWCLASSVALLGAAEPRSDVQTGIASWYGAGWSRTANGERYDPDSLTAAHRSLPFGTMVRVSNLATGRSVHLRINNRGPFRKGRIIDVSKAAARRLAMMQSGVATVEISVVK